MWRNQRTASVGLFYLSDSRRRLVRRLPLRLPIAAKRTRTIIARRQDLIQGTIKSIAALGYGNSTVQTICEAAGLSRGLIGHYFKGKDDLLIEAFSHLCARADEETRKAIRAVGRDPLQRLLAATAVTFESATSRENALVWLACCGVASV